MFSYGLEIDLLFDERDSIHVINGSPCSLRLIEASRMKQHAIKNDIATRFGLDLNRVPLNV